MKCDFCDSTYTEEVYTVPTSRTATIVYSCNDCGLLQSFSKNKGNKHTHKSISSGADWGNIRHGKKIRLSKSIETFNKYLNLSDIKLMLDVGSNRGHFVKYMINNSDCAIKAIEPDARVITDYPMSDKLEVIIQRYENWHCDIKFDLIYCCHTLEHATSASYMLKRMRDMLQDGGHLYLDVPSTAVLTEPNNVEEFFIDKHTYHFSLQVLINYLTALGFNIRHSEDDGYNIVILCTKNTKTVKNKQIVDTYRATLTANHLKMQEAAEKIHALCETHRVALYGASKIYDALVVHGQLDTKKPTHIVDDYLFGYIDQVHGRLLTKSETVTLDTVDIVILLTRSATSTLLQKLKDKGITTVIEFSNLINN